MKANTHSDAKSHGRSDHGKGKQPNEGEGNRTAAREYNRKTEAFVRSGKVMPSAEKAEQAVESNEREELERAEQVGRRPARS